MIAIKEYIENINTLLDLTNNRKVDWKKNNPTTFYFESRKGGDLVHISLQKIRSRRIKQGGYRFQITSISSGEIIVNISTEEVSLEELDILMDKLYRKVARSFEQKGLDYFDVIINNLR